MEYVLNPKHTRLLPFKILVNRIYEAHTALLLCAYLEGTKVGREVLFVRSQAMYYSSKELKDDILLLFERIDPPPNPDDSPPTSGGDFRPGIVSLVIRCVHAAWRQSVSTHASSLVPASVPIASRLSLKVKLIDAWRFGGWVLRSLREAAEKRKALGLAFVLKSLSVNRGDVKRHHINRFLMLIEKAMLVYPNDVFANFIVRVRDALFLLFQKYLASTDYLVDILTAIQEDAALEKEFLHICQGVIDRSVLGKDEKDDQGAAQGFVAPGKAELKTCLWEIYSKLTHSQAKDTMKQLLYGYAKCGSDRAYLKSITQAKRRHTSKAKGDAEEDHS
jgi:hypothetical protein